MSQLDYAPAPGFFDELFEAPGVPRPSASQLTTVLGRLGSERLRSAAERRDAIFVQQGITFDASGRMLADLDFRARVSPGADTVTPLLRPVQQELERLDAEIHERFFDPSNVATQTVTG